LDAFELFAAVNPVIERLVLPEWFADSPQYFVGLTRGNSLEALRDARKRN
jgi:hypothetical protein